MARGAAFTAVAIDESVINRLGGIDTDVGLAIALLPLLIFPGSVYLVLVPLVVAGWFLFTHGIWVQSGGIRRSRRRG